jgi:hypothetical protein
MVAGDALVTGGAAGLMGGAGSKAIAQSKYQSMVNSCLAGRGYHVVN